MKPLNREFYALIRDIIRSEEFIKMKQYKHHVKGSVYDHSIRVAYLCYLHHKKFRTKKISLAEFVRGALLHDFYLYDHHVKDRTHKFHGVTHPRRALENAKKHYPDLTVREMDMIRRHMFPLTITPPRTRGGWLLCFYDKVAAVHDYCGKNKWKIVKIANNS